jgi:hypothetical protein
MSRPQGRHSSTWWPVGWAHRRLGLGCSAKHFFIRVAYRRTRTETGKTGLLFAYYHPMDELAWPGGTGGAFGQKTVVCIYYRAVENTYYFLVLTKIPAKIA